MNLTVTPIKYNQQPNFCAGKVAYKELRQIPKLTCACCGNKMIPPEILEKALRTITQPLLSLIKKGFFADLFNDISIAAFLTDLAIKHPKDSLDKILADEECHKKITKTTGKQYLAVKHISESALRSASVVLKRIAPFREFISEDKKEIYDLFCVYAKENPRKRLSEIVQLENIQKKHSTPYCMNNDRIRMLNELHLNNVEKLIKKADPDIDSSKIIKDLKDLIYSIDDTDEEFLCKIELLLKRALSKVEKPKTKEKIIKEAQLLQKVSKNADWFFVQAKKRKWDDLAILKNLIWPSIATFEHVKPKSKGGENSIYNGIVLCEDCNTRRLSKSYREFIQYNPRMPYNVQKQLLQISDLILHGRLAGEYRDYPVKIASTLYEYSGGKIDVDIISYAQKARRKYSREVKKRAGEIHVAHKELAEKKKQIAEMEQQLKELYSETYVLKDEITTKSQASCRDKALLKQLDELLEKKKEQDKTTKDNT